MTPLAGIDLLDLDRWAREGAPHEWFARLRREAPVWRHRSPGGLGAGFWVVSRYDDVVTLSRCPHALSSDQDHGGVAGLGPGDELQDAQDDVERRLGVTIGTLGADAKMLLTLDPPEHTRYRKIVSGGFASTVLGRLEPTVRSLVAELLDAQKPGEPFDFTTEVAMPLPMTVIANMIGAPPPVHRHLLQWSNEAVASTDPEYRSGPGSMMNAAISLFQCFQDLQDRHVAEPADDLTTVLLEARVDGHELSPVRFKMFLFLLALAGNETTRNALGHAVLALAERPDQWACLRDDPSLVGSATEEVLRWASPVLYFRRTAVEPVEIAGEQIEPGDIVSLWYVSANRDESQFDRPDEFDVGRTPNRHIAFGGGPHFCLGAGLARLEVRVFLEELIDRYDRIELAGPVQRLRSNFLHGIKHLPVTLEP